MKWLRRLRQNLRCCMLRQLARKWDIDLGQSVMIGDRPSDIEAGRRAGCSALQLTGDKNLPDLVTAAIDIIKKEN